MRRGHFWPISGRDRVRTVAGGTIVAVMLMITVTG